MIVALFALPALMRFVTPMVGAVASGSGAAAGAAVGAWRRVLCPWDGRQRKGQRGTDPGQHQQHVQHSHRQLS
jgi:hypothetical protein